MHRNSHTNGASSNASDVRIMADITSGMLVLKMFFYHTVGLYFLFEHSFACLGHAKSRLV
jgi:hypothetical protein